MANSFRVPGFNIAFQTWNTYIVGKEALQGISAAWKSRFFETYRPIRNAAED